MPDVKCELGGNQIPKIQTVILHHLFTTSRLLATEAGQIEVQMFSFLVFNLMPIRRVSHEPTTRKRYLRDLPIIPSRNKFRCRACCHGFSNAQDAPHQKCELQILPSLP